MSNFIFHTEFKILRKTYKKVSEKNSILIENIYIVLIRFYQNFNLYFIIETL